MLVVILYFSVLFSEVENKLRNLLFFLHEFLHLIYILLPQHLDVQPGQLLFLLLAYFHIVLCFCRKSVDLVVLSV
jgi:hypothetical protein